jgi:DNA-binding winged helix-turn-helix (wHTH) protein/tetratricopeptide (TPR) repeat protein
LTGDFKIGSRVVRPNLNSIVCNGTSKHLEPKMMEVLVCLAEKQGEVISKEQLIRAGWPNTFVTDDVLTRCISELRRVFQDDPKEPQIIQTIPKRGYRLVAAVEPVAPAPAAVFASPLTAEAGGRVFTKRRWPLMAGAAVVAAATVGAYFFTHRKPVLTSKDPIVISDFTNTTGDAVFDGTLRQGLMAQLEQSPYLVIRSDEQIAATLRLMGQPAGARLTPELARQVCQRTGGAAVLEGSIAQIGNQYQLILNAFDCSTGARLASAQAVAADKNHVLAALSGVASSIRTRLGESLASTGKFNTPLEEVTTPSLEALQAYTLGRRDMQNSEASAAVAPLQRAISLDPNFAMAYAALGTAYWGVGESTLAAENTKKAYELRDRVSEQEKFYISSHYEESVTGDLEKAVQFYELWAQTYPQDVVPVGHVSWDYAFLGQYDESLAAGRRALALAPNVELPYEVLASSYLNLDRLDDAAAILQQAKARGIDSSSLHELAYVLAFLKGDTAGMARELAWAAGKEDSLLEEYGSDTAAYAGHLAQANDLTARAVASARRAGEKEVAAGYLAEAALREALVGNDAPAREQAALKASNGANVEAVAALTLALSGNIAQAQKLADDKAKRFPQDTFAQFFDLPTIRAAIGLRENSPAKAIADLQAASPYELGSSGFLSLYPVYVRGQAYLEARQGAAAAGEFQKILDHHGIAFNEIIVPLAYLGLGRARALAGDKPGSQKAYQDFFALWQQADSNLPILQQAKAEYARLR